MKPQNSGRVLMQAMLGAALLACGTAATAQDFPHAPLKLKDKQGQAELRILGDSAAVAFTAEGSARTLRAIDRSDDALAVLADPRLAFAEPELLRWAGPDLTVLRDRALAHGKVEFENALRAIAGSAAEKETGERAARAAITYAGALVDGGKSAEAIALLRGQIAALPAGSEADETRAALTNALGQRLFGAGHADEAISTYESAIKTAPEDKPFRTSLTINFARTLARAGQAQRASDLIEAAWRKFEKAKDSVRAEYKIADAENAIAWIRACAVEGVGQKAQAREIMKWIDTAPREGKAKHLRSVSALKAGYLCMHDAAALAGVLAGELADADPAADIFLSLDPLAYTYPAERAVVVEALRDPALVKAMDGKVRPLTRYAAAVSHWNDAPAP